MTEEWMVERDGSWPVQVNYRRRLKLQHNYLVVHGHMAARGRSQTPTGCHPACRAFEGYHIAQESQLL